MRRTVAALRAWLVQRISAVYMLLFFLFLLFHFVLDPPHSCPAWRGWMRNPGVSVAPFVFFTALLLHAWVGVRDVVMDYVHPLALRVSVLALLGFSLMAGAAWVVRILMREAGWFVRVHPVCVLHEPVSFVMVEPRHIRLAGGPVAGVSLYYRQPGSSHPGTTG